MSMRSAIKIVMVMNERLNNTLDSYNFKNGTIIIVDISGFTKLVYNTDLTTGKNITLCLYLLSFEITGSGCLLPK